ncbi:unnamed protein product [Camellia sinensis]
MKRKRTDFVSWVVSKARIHYRSSTGKIGKRRGSTTFSNFSDEASLDVFSVTVNEEENDREVKARFKRQMSYNDPTFVKPFFMNRIKHGDTIVSVTERVPMRFRKWLNKSSKKQWIRADTIVAGLQPEYQKVFSWVQIGNGLKVMLFRNEFHGELEKGVRVSKEGMVKLMLPSPSSMDFENGLKKDIGDFKTMVQMVEKLGGYNGPCPPALDLLYKLCDGATKLTGKDLTLYEQIVKFDRYPVEMTGWMNRLNHPEFADLADCFDVNSHVYMQTYGLVKFHRNFLTHFADYKTLSGARRVEYAMECLFFAIPDFVPKFFYIAATTVKAHEKSFIEVDSDTGKVVSDELVGFLRSGRDALP